MATSSPGALADPFLLEDRLSKVRIEPRVAPLNDWVESARAGLGQGYEIPWFDPAGGGVDARILFLLEAPGQKSVSKAAALNKVGSGIISGDNNDFTAKQCWEGREAAGLTYRQVVHWNVVPWYIGSANKIASPGVAEIERALPLLHQVIERLPRLEIVVLMGRKAQDGWARYSRRYAHELLAIPTWHPSQRVFNTKPSAKAEFRKALLDAKGALLPLR
ncbi:uracil-DNA glycosylase [Pseudonocardia sp. D17]|uniref:uracil-DNA glycosylase n=1 Tax=Pseudonocardia sp. D17 TaxID=882661 RepID=UPI002B3DBFCA|nr:hypothetical protein PSD17_06610 [Pseudonocardia sp. D17]